MMKVTTDEGVFYTDAVTEDLMRRSMRVYIQRKRDEGYQINEIMYVWGPIDVVPAQGLLTKVGMK